jgi:hypothetical protein
MNDAGELRSRFRASQVESMPSPMSYIVGFAMGGAASRVDPDATPLGVREIGYEINMVGVLPPGSNTDDRHRTWVRRGWEALRPHSTGVYAKFLSDEGASGVRRAYGEHFGRLTALKTRYDRTNFFRQNANIPPGD